jgi:microcystin-dependent protein
VNSVAIGFGAGSNTQGNNSVAIGAYAGYGSQVTGSIAINASGVALNPANAGCYINPVRNDSNTTSGSLYGVQYNPTTYEMTYGTFGSPVGTITMFAGSTAPTGWLICNGASYSTGTYANLFAIIGYIYGGLGANFNVPNLVTKFPAGAGGAYALGNSTSFNSMYISSNQLAPHTHGLSAAGTPTINDPGHSHTFNAILHREGSMYDFAGPRMFATPEQDGTTSIATTGITASWPAGSRTDSVPTVAQQPYLPPTLFVNYIIRY